VRGGGNSGIFLTGKYFLARGRAYVFLIFKDNQGLQSIPKKYFIDNDYL